MFGENIGSLADISLTLIRLRIHWPTLTIIRCQWSCNRLQYVKLCASSLFFRPYLDVWLLQKKWIDWVRQWFWVESSVLHCMTFLRLKKLWFGISGKNYDRVVVQGVPKVFQSNYLFNSTNTIQLWSCCHAYAAAIFFCIFKED